jgi:hypothetical protein
MIREAIFSKQIKGVQDGEEWVFDLKSLPADRIDQFWFDFSEPLATYNCDLRILIASVFVRTAVNSYCTNQPLFFAEEAHRYVRYGRHSVCNLNLLTTFELRLLLYPVPSDLALQFICVHMPVELKVIISKYAVLTCIPNLNVVCQRFMHRT